MTQIQRRTAGAAGEGDTTGNIKILITDRVAQEGVDLLRAQLPEAQIDERPGLKPEQLKAIIGEYSALIVRSETQVTSDVLAAASRMKIVGRAGVGVDNIDTEAATQQGIIVVNSPTGNIIAAAEHSVAMLLALARRIHASPGRITSPQISISRPEDSRSASLVADWPCSASQPTTARGSDAPTRTSGPFVATHCPT